jgi:hypothetical protein
VNVKANVAVGVHLKLLVTFISNEPSLSVVTVPRCGAVHVVAVADDGTEFPLIVSVPVMATPPDVIDTTVDPLDCKLIMPEASAVVCTPPVPVVIAFMVDAI